MDNETSKELNERSILINSEYEFLQTLKGVIGNINDIEKGIAKSFHNKFKIATWVDGLGWNDVCFEGVEEKELGAKPLLMALHFIKEEVLKRIEKMEENFRKI